MGHMTTRFYMAMFDDSSYHFLNHVFGWNSAQDPTGRYGWVDVHHSIDYQAEVDAGDLLEVRAELTKVGGKSMKISYEMINLGSGDVAATLEGVVVLFDLNERCAVAIPDDIRETAQSHVGTDFV